ncbi:MAG: DUF47 domain-containing protein [Promethearchaeota archaeon]
MSKQKVKDQINSLLIDHVRILFSILSDMAVSYTNWSEGNTEYLERKKRKMQLTEEDADSIKIKLIQDFSEVGAQGLGEYVALILRMDNVINSALEFVDILSYISDNINDEIKKRYHKLINLIIEIGSALKTTIKNMRDNPEEVFNNTTTIHEIENEIDSAYREFLNYLYDNKDIDIRLLLKIRDSIMILENLADRIHDIADHIRIIIYQ